MVSATVALTNFLDGQSRVKHSVSPDSHALAHVSSLHVCLIGQCCHGPRTHTCSFLVLVSDRFKGILSAMVVRGHAGTVLDLVGALSSHGPRPALHFHHTTWIIVEHTSTKETTAVLPQERPRPADIAGPPLAARMTSYLPIGYD
jgi:hypothetical protein